MPGVMKGNFGETILPKRQDSSAIRQEESVQFFESHIRSTECLLIISYCTAC